MLDALARGGLLGLLSDRARSLKGLSRPDKIYLGDPNLMHALSSAPDAGTSHRIPLWTFGLLY